MKLVFTEKEGGSAKDFADELVGEWAKPIWNLKDLPLPNRSTDLDKKVFKKEIDFRSHFQSSSLCEQIQYGCMRALIDGDWSLSGFESINPILNHFSRIFIKYGPINSLLDKDWHEWENILTQWYRNNYPKSFRFKTKLVQDQVLGYRREKKEIVLPEGMGRFRRIYGKVYDYINTDNRDEWEKDNIDLVKLGLWEKGDPKKLRCSEIFPLWLRDCFRRYAREKIAQGASFSSITQYLTCVTYFGSFIQKRKSGVFRPQDVNRKVLLELIQYINTECKVTKASTKQKVGEPLMPRTKDNYIRNIAKFIKESGRMKLAPFPPEELIDSNDIPKIPKGDSMDYIPEYVVEQMLDNIEKLLYPWSSMLRIGLHVGSRISDCLKLPLNCLVYDDEGDPYLLQYSNKTSTDYPPIPITDIEVHEAIIQAKKKAIKIAGDDCKYLFPSGTSGEHYHPGSGKHRFRNWIYQCKIKDEDGALWQFNFKQCRSTTGMRIINNGGDERDVKYVLGHNTLAVGRKYARIVDCVKKEIWAKYKGIVVDVLGKKVASLDNVNSAEAQWLKLNIRTQALPNGYCKKPIREGKCVHGNRCLKCPMFRTCASFLPVHKNHLKRCLTAAENAKQLGQERVQQLNEFVALNLERIIAGIENYAERHSHEF